MLPTVSAKSASAARSPLTSIGSSLQPDLAAVDDAAGLAPPPPPPLPPSGGRYGLASSLSTSSLPCSFGLAPPPSNANSPFALMASNASCASVKPILLPTIARLPLISSNPNVSLPSSFKGLPVHSARPRTDGILRSIGPSTFIGLALVTLPL